MARAAYDPWGCLAFVAPTGVLAVVAAATAAALEIRGLPTARVSLERPRKIYAPSPPVKHSSGRLAQVPRRLRGRPGPRRRAYSRADGVAGLLDV